MHAGLSLPSTSFFPRAVGDEASLRLGISVFQSVQCLLTEYLYIGVNKLNETLRPKQKS